MFFNFEHGELVVIIAHEDDILQQNSSKDSLLDKDNIALY